MKILENKENENGNVEKEYFEKWKFLRRISLNIRSCLKLEYQSICTNILLPTAVDILNGKGSLVTIDELKNNHKNYQVPQNTRT